jgi:hypothetical protein
MSFVRVIYCRWPKCMIARFINVEPYSSLCHVVARSNKKDCTSLYPDVLVVTEGTGAEPVNPGQEIGD